MFVIAMETPLHFARTSVNESGKYRWLLAVMLFGAVYLLIGIAFPNPSAPTEKQFLWRLAAWIVSAIVFAIHICYEHFRLRNSTRTVAAHASMAAALGAFALSVAANIHALRTGAGNGRLLLLSLVLWPFITAVPAFLAALGCSAGLARLFMRSGSNNTEG